MAFTLSKIINDKIKTEAEIINDKIKTEAIMLNGMRMAYPVTEPILLNIPTYDGSGQAVHPSVVVPQSPNGLFGGYRYWMAMTPFANSQDALENPSILCSNDGIEWNVPKGVANPLVKPLENGQFNADPNLVFNPYDGYLYLYWNAQGKNIGGNGINAIGRMIKSKNGVSWSDPVEIKAISWSGKEVPITFSGSGIEVLSDGSWIALLNRKSGGNAYSCGQANMTLFISSDGLTWSELPSTYDNLAGSHWHISFRRFSDGFHFISSVTNNESGSPYNLGLYYGYSPDGQAPLFDGTPLFGLDRVKTNIRKWYASCIVPIGTKTSRVYFSQQHDDGTWHIGYFDVVVNNPYVAYVQSPNYMMRYTPVWHQFNLRDADYHVSTPINGNQTVYYGLRKMIEFRECALICINSLTDSDNQPISVKIESINRYCGATQTTTLDGIDQIITVPSSTKTVIITKNTFGILGVRSLDRVGLKIKAEKVPANGYVSIYLVPQT